MSDEMTYSEYDLEVLRNGEKDKQRQFETEKNEAYHAARQADQKHERRMEAIKHVFYAVCVSMVIAGVLGFVYMIWQATAGPSADDQRKERLQTACIEEGGTWLTIDNGGSAGSPTCLFLKETP